jgi:hypothetical protein
MKVHEAPTGFGFAFNTSPATLHAVSDAPSVRVQSDVGKQHLYTIQKML